MKRPANLEPVEAVIRGEGRYWHKVQSVHDAGVHVVIDMRHHWYKWAAVRKVR